MLLQLLEYHHQESRTTQILFKNVGHIAETEEAQLLASHDTMGLRQDKTTRDMARLVNVQIAAILESTAGTAGADWGARSATTGLATNRPGDDIQTAVTAIRYRDQIGCTSVSIHIR